MTITETMCLASRTQKRPQCPPPTHAPEGASSRHHQYPTRLSTAEKLTNWVAKRMVESQRTDERRPGGAANGCTPGAAQALTLLTLAMEGMSGESNGLGLLG